MGLAELRDSINGSYFADEASVVRERLHQIGLCLGLGVWVGPIGSVHAQDAPGTIDDAINFAIAPRSGQQSFPG